MSQKSSIVDVIGRSCRLPSAASVEEFRRLLFSNTCAVREIPAERWRTAQFYHPERGVVGKTYCSSAGLVEDLFSFDPKVFGISPREAKLLDPQQRLLLVVVWEALEDAGLVPSEVAGSDVGVFVGASTTEHGTVLTNDPEMSDPYTMTGNALSLIANRVSHVFDWRGPSMTIDTACSSSLYALAAAKNALERGEIDIAVVGATNALLSPNYFAGFSAARMLSPTGLCQAFSANADGYVRGEGAIAFVLKRSEDTEGQSYAKIRHVELNTSGRTVNIALPSVEAQRSLLRAAYERSGTDPEQLAFVEAHGTGTRVGDPIEADALGQELGLKRSSMLKIGSVKSNIGHLEPAAGCAGLLKSMLALEDGKLPATLHAHNLNPEIPFEELNLKVVRETVALDGDKSERFAGISSFGFGGANSHCILSYEPPTSAAKPATHDLERPILLVSAYCEAAANENLIAYSKELAGSDAQRRCDVLDGALHQRGRFNYRTAVLADSLENLASAVEAAIENKPHPALISGETQLDNSPIVYLFSGNGAQYVGMCRLAFESDRKYRDAFEEISKAWEPIAGWSLIDKIYSDSLDEELPRAPVAQPLLFADQVAMVRALKARGVYPSAVIGHSGGEVAAAHISGALTLEEALRLNFVRSSVQDHLYGRGTMAAVQATREEIAEVIKTDYENVIAIAAVNSPRSVSIVGPKGAVDTFIRDVRKRKRWASVRLKFDYPFHSPLQDEIKDELKERLDFLKPGPAAIEFLSSVEGVPVHGERLDAEYWWQNVRRTVLFDDAVSHAVSAGYNCFLEIGPDPVLLGYVRTRLSEANLPHSLFHSGERKETSSTNPVLRTVARALCSGASVDLNCISQTPTGAVRGLPYYQFQGEDFSALGSKTIKRLTGRGPSYHPLLGVADDNNSAVWHNEIDASTQPVFADHVLSGRAIMPGTALVEMALAAVKRSQKIETFQLFDVDFHAPVPLSSPTMSELCTKVSGRYSSMQITSRPRFEEGDWIENASCRFVRSTEDIGSPMPPERSGPGEPGEKLYRLAEKIGLDYGPAFARLERWQRPDEATIEVFLSAYHSEHYSPEEFELDPVGMDAILHSLIAYVDGSTYADQALGFVPARVERITVKTTGKAISSGRLRIRKAGARSILADVEVFGHDGLYLGSYEGLRFKAVRLYAPINFESQSFRIERLPLHLSERSSLQENFVEELEKLLARKELEATVGDDVEHLLDAAARRVWYDALARPSTETEVELIGQSSWLHAYRDMSMKRLSACGLGHSVDGVFQVASEIDLPEADELIAGILAERPDLVGECSTLAALSQMLPSLFNGTLEGTAQSLFGAGTLKMVQHQFGLLLGHRKDTIDVLLSVLRTCHQTKPLRVAELTFAERPFALYGLLADEVASNWSLTHIVCSEELPPFDLPKIGLSMPDIKTVTLSTLEKEDPFDLVVCMDAWAGDFVTPEIKDHLGASLRPGGVAVVLAPNGRDHRRAMSVFEPSVFLGKAKGLASTPPVERTFVSRPGASILTLTAGTSGSQEPMDPLYAVRPELASGGMVPQAMELLLGEGVDVSFDAETGIQTFSGGDAEATYIYCHPKFSDDQLGTRLLRIGEMLERKREKSVQVVFLVPNGSSLSGNAPEAGQSALWAFLRTARNEYPEIFIQSVDFDDDVDTSSLAARLAQLMKAAVAETELHFSRDGIGVARVKCGAMSSGYRPAFGENQRSVLTADPAGGLDRLRWQVEDMPTLDENDVCVKIGAAGVNYRDVMWAMDLLPEEALEDGFAGPHLGIECAGQVEAVGSGVLDLKVGDRVATFGPGCFASHINVDADVCVKLPNHIDDASAATIPVTFFTAHYSLVTLADLQPGETVLIHGGAGGVGLAAIQVANKVGARVIATAGTETKRALLESLGVEHVLNSRSLEFSDDIRKLTEGAGVDVVLNSIAKVGMEQSLRLMKPFGRFLELGKQDFYSNTSIGLRPLRKNTRYFAVDIDQYIAAHPSQARTQFQKVLQYFEDGSFAPLPHQTFDGAQVNEAFRVMQRSEHIGKVVVRPAPVAAVGAGNLSQMVVPDPNAWTVITGGASGIGLKIADRLTEKGARYIALLGRSELPTKDAQALIERDPSITVKYLSCDITDQDQLEEALETLRSERKITAVIHSAMVLEDMRICELGPAVLKRVMDAKTVGTRNLDNLTRRDPLKYFIAFTSMATLIGNHGQAAYVAGNAYLEAVIRARRESGLPGLAIGWGAISDVGYLTRDDQTAEILRRFGGGVEFTSNQMLRVFEQLSNDDQRITDQSTLWVSPMSWAAALDALSIFKAPMYESLAHLGQRTATSQEYSNLRDQILLLPSEEATDKVAKFLRAEMARILRSTQDQLSLDQPIGDFGLDSLMGVELGLSVQQALGGDVPIAGIATTLSINEIAHMIVTSVTNMDQVGAAGSVLSSMAQQHLADMPNSAGENDIIRQQTIRAAE